MKSFQSLAWSEKRCCLELNRLRSLLERKATLEEQNDVLPVFKKSPHLLGLLGSYALNASPMDQVATEYDLFGDYQCDLVAGDSRKQAFLFVELEGAGPDSVFKRLGKKAQRDWSPRFDHGYSQIIDWFGKLRDMEKTDEFEARFGARSIEYAGLLIVGRERYFQAGERHRFEWRRRSVVVDSRKIQCVTYDELLADLTYRLSKYGPGTPAT